MEVAQAVVQHALDVSHLYKSNMALRHGLDRPERLVVDEPPAAGPAPVPPVPTTPGTTPIAIPGPTSPAAAKSSLLPWALVVASLAGGGAGLGALANSWFTRQPAAAPTINVQGERGLLEYLQEQGYHLPPADAGGPPS